MLALFTICRQGTEHVIASIQVTYGVETGTVEQATLFADCAEAMAEALFDWEAAKPQKYVSLPTSGNF